MARFDFLDGTDTDVACDLWFAVRDVCKADSVWSDWRTDRESDVRDAPSMEDRQYLPKQARRDGAPDRDNSGKLPAYAWPGGYPIVYLAADGGTFCPACANGENGSEASEDPIQTDRQWLIVAWDVHWEGQPEICDHCYAEIESAYGDPDSDDD